MLARVLAEILEKLPWEGLLLCHTDEAVYQLNQSIQMIIQILMNIFSFVWSISLIMVELWWNSTVYFQWLISIMTY